MVSNEDRSEEERRGELGGEILLNRIGVSAELPQHVALTHAMS